jgi:hypothetical protein
VASCVYQKTTKQYIVEVFHVILLGIMLSIYRIVAVQVNIITYSWSQAFEGYF